jgi:hypothetical protein
MTDLDDFEVALLAELRTKVSRRSATRGSRSRTRLFAIAGVSTLGCAVLASVMITHGAAPAYAVVKQDDGDIVVTVNRLDDAAGLKERLARLGVEADVRYWATDTSREPMDGGEVGRLFDPRTLPVGHRVYTAKECEASVAAELTSSDGGFTITIPRHTVESGENLTILTAGTDISTASLLVAAGNRSSGCANILDERAGMAAGWFVWGPTATRANDTGVDDVP